MTVPFKTNKVGPKGLYVNENNTVKFLSEEGTWCRCVMCGEWKKDQEFFGDNNGKISIQTCFSCYNAPEKIDEFLERTRKNYSIRNAANHSTNRKVDALNNDLFDVTVAELIEMLSKFPADMKVKSPTVHGVEYDYSEEETGPIVLEEDVNIAGKKIVRIV